MSGENMLSKYQHTPLALGFTIVVILCWVGRGILVVCMLLFPPWLEGPEGGCLPKASPSKMEVLSFQLVCYV